VKVIHFFFLHRYYTRKDAESCMKYVNGTKLDDRIIRTDWDRGYKKVSSISSSFFLLREFSSFSIKSITFSSSFFFRDAN